eukprot:8470594-Pyramimonas_sp.AAC.1
MLLYTHNVSTGLFPSLTSSSPTRTVERLQDETELTTRKLRVRGKNYAGLVYSSSPMQQSSVGGQAPQTAPTPPLRSRPHPLTLGANQLALGGGWGL